MTKKRTSMKKQSKKPKNIGLIFNKVFEDFKKNQKINERKDLKLREETIKKERIKIHAREKDLKIKEEEFKRKEEHIKKKDEDLRKKDAQLIQKDDDLRLKEKDQKRIV